MGNENNGLKEGVLMFKKGEFVVYGSRGVCEVMDITTVDYANMPKNTLYYVLHPYYQKESKIFTPVDNQKTSMRKLISKDEANALIKDIPNIGYVWINNDKLRESKYKECIRSCDCKELVSVIKTLYLRKRERIEEGKKITATDEKYLKMAEEHLYSELLIPLGISKIELEKCIMSNIL